MKRLLLASLTCLFTAGSLHAVEDQLTNGCPDSQAPSVTPAAMPAPKPIPKPVAIPAPKPAPKPAIKPAPKPAAMPAAMPASKPTPKPVVMPAPKPKPAVMPTPPAKPVLKPAPAVKPAAMPAPAAKPAAMPAPAAKPAAMPAPAAKPAAMPTAKPTTNPAEPIKVKDAGASTQDDPDADKDHDKKRCRCCKDYASFYTKRDVLVCPGFSIPFDNNTDSVCSRGICHEAESGDIVIKHPGVYRVTYSVSLGWWGRVALTLNDNVVPGSEMYIADANTLSTLSFLVKICDRPDCDDDQKCCGNVLRVINNNPPPTIWCGHDILIKGGYYDDSVGAAILIEKVDCCPKCDK